MRRISLVFIMVIILVSGCSSNQKEELNKSILFEFNEPFRFPFEINEVSTEVAMDNPDLLQQYVLHYKNKQTTQEIRYILSKVIDEPEKISEQIMKQVDLKNGKKAYYKEDETSQSIWWDGEDGFVSRFIYYINGNSEKLGSYKLDESDLIDLVDQVYY